MWFMVLCANFALAKASRKLTLALLLPGVLAAHPGEPLAPHDLWSAWTFDAGVVIPLVIAAVLFYRGKGGVAWRVRCFWTGWTLLAYGLVSPLHALGESLFSAHMVQHEVLMVLAAPLLVLSKPMVPMLFALPMEWRRTVGGWGRPFHRMWDVVTSPAGAWIIHAAALWGWHIPWLFQSTLSSEWAHAAQHASFFFSALLFWWSVFNGHGRQGYGVALISLFTTVIHTSILGALLTLSPTVWYPLYTNTEVWGLTALEDQQLGGLIMWVPAGVAYVIAALACLGLLLRQGQALATTTVQSSRPPADAKRFNDSRTASSMPGIVPPA
jgi:cytochrome c oxidase assembly factor CtaG